MQVISDATDPNLPLVNEQSTLNDALDAMLVASTGAALVAGRRDVFTGLITVNTVMDAISTGQAAAQGGGDAPVGLNTGSLPEVADDAATAGSTAAGASDDSTRTPAEGQRAPRDEHGDDSSATDRGDVGEENVAETRDRP